VIEKPTEFEAGELLRAIGKVEGPEPRVLEDAREVLWSAVASEMLGTGPADEQTTATREPAGREEEQHRTTQRRQTGRSQDERKMSMGRRDPDS
jgi:hypothetical protein